MKYCPTKTFLLAEWQNAAETYSKAVAEFSRQVGMIPKVEHQKLGRAAESAREPSTGARTILEAHMQAHCCGQSGSLNFA